MRVLLFMMTTLLFTVSGVLANDPYTVSNIAVDMQGTNAIEARDNAHAKARRDAFNILTGRLLDRDSQSRLPDAGDNDIAAMVNNFEINREKYSKDRYLASLNITFNPNAVRGYLQRYATYAPPAVSYNNPPAVSAETPYGVPVTIPDTPVVTSTTRLILPWYGEGGNTTLWRDPNPWREAWTAWTQTAQARDLGIVTPLGDITDMQMFNPAKPLSFDNDALQKLLNRYQANYAIIAMADPLPNGMMRVSLYQSTTMTPRFIDRIVAAGTTAGGTHNFLPAIYQSADRIREKTDSASSSVIAQTPVLTIDSSVTTPVEAEVRLASLQQWIGVRQSLTMVGGISDLQIRSLSAGRAVVAFRYNGDPQALRADLGQRGLGLFANPVQAGGIPPYVIIPQNG